jgi:hypothetical protein
MGAVVAADEKAMNKIIATFKKELNLLTVKQNKYYGTIKGF